MKLSGIILALVVFLCCHVVIVLAQDAGGGGDNVDDGISGGAGVVDGGDDTSSSSSLAPDSAAVPPSDEEENPDGGATGEDVVVDPPPADPAAAATADEDAGEEEEVGDVEGEVDEAAIEEEVEEEIQGDIAEDVEGEDAADVVEDGTAAAPTTDGEDATATDAAPVDDAAASDAPVDNVDPSTTDAAAEEETGASGAPVAGAGAGDFETVAPTGTALPPIKCDEQNVDLEYYAGRTVRDVILERENLSRFRETAVDADLFDTMMKDPEIKLTVIAPRNHAIETSPLWMKYLEKHKSFSANLRKTLHNHIITQQALTAEELETGMHNTLEDPVFGDVNRGTIDEIEILCSIPASNGYVHIVGEIIRPKFYDHDLSDLEMMPEFGPDRDVAQRVSLVTVVDFLDYHRNMLRRDPPNGMTHIGCRIRAFNRINDYHKWTINEAEVKSVKYGELLNETFRNESFHNFIEYNLIDHVYDVDAMEHGFEELIMSRNDCAHMWVTKHQEKICFNNACLVIGPPAFSKIGTPVERRIQYATNGVGYVVDKCLVCPGVSMLAEYASEFTVHNMKDVSQFFTSSEWNRRNLSLDVGDGGPVTLFAAVNTGWDALTGEDITRLSTDMWKEHQRDFLRHMMVQGNYTEAQLREKIATEGNGTKLNMTSLANQTLYFEIDEERDDKLMLNGGDMFFSDIRGVDGMMHFVTKVPLVRSVTHSVYDIGHWLGDHYEQMNLIDGQFLDSDMRRLEPITALYAPDADWKNKVLEIDQIEPILENHIYEGLLWCDRLREMAKDRETLESESKQVWAVSVNDFNMPCFDSITDRGEEVARACITECDHLARNGIVHVIDVVILTEEIATRGPMPPLPEGQRPPIRPDGLLDGGGGGHKPWYHQEHDDTPVDFGRPKRWYPLNEVDDLDEDDEEIAKSKNNGEKSAAAGPGFQRTVTAVAAVAAAIIPLLLA